MENLLGAAEKLARHGTRFRVRGTANARRERAKLRAAKQMNDIFVEDARPTLKNSFILF
jgi:hypothetical protein